MKPYTTIAVCTAFILSVAVTYQFAEAHPDMQQLQTYTNPVINRNFPDPSILNDHGTYYAYSTNSGGIMPCARSSDLVRWTALPDAMPQLPGWALGGHTWAPNVRKFSPGRYVAYFTARDKITHQQAIGVAVGTSPSGPFLPAPDAAPLVAQADLGGAIDPSCFVGDHGKRYLVWKNDGNSRGEDTWLWIQQLSRDGLHLVGPLTRLIKQDQPWEGNLIEAPTLWKHGKKYYLFYSANSFANCSYAIGYAVSDHLMGPYARPRSTPWVSSSPGVCGPGGEDIVRSHKGDTWMSYHTWAKGPHSYRAMSIDALTWSGDVPVLHGPSTTPQPAPR